MYSWGLGFRLEALGLRVNRRDGWGRKTPRGRLGWNVVW